MCDSRCNRIYSSDDYAIASSNAFEINELLKSLNTLFKDACISIKVDVKRCGQFIEHEKVVVAGSSSKAEFME